MLKYLGRKDLGLSLVDRPRPIQEAECLYGLPEYAYDGHTRTGQRALVIACGNKLIKGLFSSLSEQTMEQVKARGGKIKLLTWLLFFEEGGLLAEEQVDQMVESVEQRVVAAGFGMTVAQWEQAKSTMHKVLPDLREYRLAALASAYD
jgi:hypothetical protein